MPVFVKHNILPTLLSSEIKTCKHVPLLASGLLSFVKLGPASVVVSSNLVNRVRECCHRFKFSELGPMSCCHHLKFSELGPARVVVSSSLVNWVPRELSSAQV